MAMYPYYPSFANYQQLQPQMQMQQSQLNQANSSIIWVQGEAGAKSYLVAPNNTVALWDSESKTIYLKSCDASGMPSIKTLDYTIRENGSVGANFAPNSEFVTKDYITIVEDRINALEGKLDALSVPKKTTSTRKEQKDE